MKVKFSDSSGQEHVFEAEGFEVTTQTIYSTHGGKRCVGLHADWDGGSGTWHALGKGLILKGASFEGEGGVEVTIAGRKPLYAGTELVSVYGRGGPGEEALILWVHDNGYRDCAVANGWGWLEQDHNWTPREVRERNKRRKPKKRGSLLIQPAGTYQPRLRRRPLFRTPLEASPRSRLSGLAERLR